MNRLLALAFCLTLLCCLPTIVQGAESKFRTDGGDAKLPWFQLKPGEFPPEGSGHYISGELIGLDHINRTGVLRMDRDDTQRRGEWDRPHAFRMLPYGTITYHGAPAELRDVPIGTHLHGLFYIEGPLNKEGKGTFPHCLQLEDDFSYFSRQQKVWRIDAVNLETGSLTVTAASTDGKQADLKPVTFQVIGSTRVWKARSIGTLADLKAAQNVLINITVCGLKGPGRCTDIWLDEESRQVARDHQLEVHRHFQREHGLAGIVDEVDNEKSIVSVTLFAGFDPKLKEDFPVGDVINALVTEDSLRTWDQINDKKSGPIVELLWVTPGPGNSGFRLRFKAGMLLEGYRPKRIVRILSSKWKLDDLPKEERLYP